MGLLWFNLACDFVGLWRDCLLLVLVSVRVVGRFMNGLLFYFISDIYFVGLLRIVWTGR